MTSARRCRRASGSSGARATDRFIPRSSGWKCRNWWSVRGELKRAVPAARYMRSRGRRRELQEWLTRKPQMQPFRNELLLKLFFGRLVPREACQEHLRHFRQRQEDFLRTYGQVERWLHAEHEGHPDLPFWMMTLTYGVHQAQALRDWCDQTLAALGKSGKAR